MKDTYAKLTTGRAMKVKVIKRGEASDVAARLRLLALRIETGEVAYCVMHTMDYKNQVDQIIFDRLTNVFYGSPTASHLR